MSPVDQDKEMVRPPIRCYLTGDELATAVAAQLDQRARQGYRDVSPTVLARVAQIVAPVRWATGTSTGSSRPDDHSAIDRAA